jgi:threonine dehydrogenase-like Zn-dependent dehydrogenase
MSTGWLIQSYWCTVLYAGCYIVYLMIKRMDIKAAIQEMKAITDYQSNKERKTIHLNIVVVGTGYVGLVTGVCLADIGYQVVCVDIDETKINMINSGKAPV